MTLEKCPWEYLSDEFMLRKIEVMKLVTKNIICDIFLYQKYHRYLYFL